MENVITLGKLIGLLFCSLPPLYFVFENSKNTRNQLAHPVMGTIFLVIVNALIVEFPPNKTSLQMFLVIIIS